jgi:hypothetical protein
LDSIAQEIKKEVEFAFDFIEALDLLVLCEEDLANEGIGGDIYPRIKKLLSKYDRWHNKF